MTDANSPENKEESLDIENLDTPSFLRKEVRGFRKTLSIGRRNRNREGGSTLPNDPRSSTIKMRPNQITSLDSLGYSELDSYQDSSALKNLKTVVRRKT